ncbi:MAG: pentapeptide repeat-containing protein [Acidimicrobiales bacterium]
MTVAGAAGATAAGLSSDEVGAPQTVQQISVGLLTGGLIGVTLLIIEQRREDERDAHDDHLARRQQRHLLAVALATKDDLREIKLAGQDLQGVVLSFRDLSGADLYRSELRNANLREADLTSSICRHADMADALFWEADLTNADLAQADLSGANFTKATLVRTNLTKADLTRAQFPGADLTGADLTGANLSGAKFGGGANEYGMDLPPSKIATVSIGEVWWDANNPPQWPLGFEPPENCGPPASS